jgi:hypothetical protein
MLIINALDYSLFFAPHSALHAFQKGKFLAIGVRDCVLFYDMCNPMIFLLYF